MTIRPWLTTLTALGLTIGAVAHAGDFDLLGRIAPDGLTAGDAIGNPIAVDGSRAVLGAYQSDTPSTNTGVAYVVAWDGESWVTEAKLSAPSLTSGVNWGYSVGISGDTVVIGSMTGGAADVFRRTSGTWQHEATLTGEPGIQRFGNGVAIEGETIVVAAPDARVTYTTKVHVFEHRAGQWTHQQTLDSHFWTPSSASISMRGGTIAVGSGNSSNGHASVFTRDDFGIWGFESILVPLDAGTQDYFGGNVAVGADFVVVGAMRQSSPVSQGGSAYVFRHEGGAWAQSAKLTSSDIATNDAFGMSVSTRGGLIAVGAPVKRNGGALYLFQLQAGIWTEIRKLTPSGTPTAGTFGMGSAVSSEQLLIGAPSTAHIGSLSGVVFAFTHPPLDGDLDGVVDPLDNCPDAANPEQSDVDGDSLGDACDALVCGTIGGGAGGEAGRPLALGAALASIPATTALRRAARRA